MASDALTYPELEAYLAIGTSGAAGAGRISYRLGLQGPCGQRRHGLQFVVGGDPPGLPGPAFWANATSRQRAEPTPC